VKVCEDWAQGMWIIVLSTVIVIDDGLDFFNISNYLLRPNFEETAIWSSFLLCGIVNVDLIIEHAKVTLILVTLCKIICGIFLPWIDWSQGWLVQDHPGETGQ
jgi:hypothetical protein